MRPEPPGIQFRAVGLDREGKSLHFGIDREGKMSISIFSHHGRANVSISEDDWEKVVVNIKQFRKDFANA